MNFKLNFVGRRKKQATNYTYKKKISKFENSLISANDECTLNCRPFGLNFYATLNKAVIDGTSCHYPMTSMGQMAPRGTQGVCVDGYCKVRFLIH